MDKLEIIKYIIGHPNDTGVLTFILGILFILSIYHFLLYLQNKDKVYLYYSVYTFLIFINQLPQATEGFTHLLFAPHFGMHPYILNITMWMYNMMYFVFAFTFLDLKDFSKRWDSFINKTVYIASSIMTLVVLTAWFRGDISILVAADGFVVLFYLFFGLACYIPLLSFKIPLKNYIFIGGFILFISSLTAYYSIRVGLLSAGESYTIFYFGVIVENLIFSLALGHRQKIVLQTKNKAQKKLIQQLKENEKLRIAIHDQLEKDVFSYSQKAEEAKLEKLKATFDKEISELKIASLRNQMNPHFIFNSLNSIKLYIIENDKEKAIYYLNKFSKLIRKILGATREKEMYLSDEIETTKLYIDIENIRFGNQIQTSFYVDPSLQVKTIKIPSLILQPFVENAIWHGLSPKKGEKRIGIKMENEDQKFLKITISDNGIGRKRSAEIKSNKIHKRESVGIKITEERLRNFCKDYSSACSIEFKDLKEGEVASGTSVVLRIPLK